MPASPRSLEQVVTALLARIEGPLRIATPLGLGKPNRLVNALYDHCAGDPDRALYLYTALSLDTPGGGSDLEKRFLAPFVERLYGQDYPRLKYVSAMRRDALPANIEVEEFYFQSGAMLHSRQAQRRYASLNYTRVADALADRGINCIVQRVAAREGDARLSLSSNTDLTTDTLAALARAGLPRPLMVAEIDPMLPWIGQHALVDAGFFDLVVEAPASPPKLFALPRQPVGDIDHAIGLYASTLVRDGGTLQIGIGALADALSHALVLRHTDNARYRAVLRALDPGIDTHPLVQRWGGLDPFEHGLYGCSEMINEGFRVLAERGVLKRRVLDDLPLMQRIAGGSASAGDHARLAEHGDYLRGAFYLGSPAFYDWLRAMDDTAAGGIDMRAVGEINALSRDNETLERLQRRDGRFFNTCMMASALGAATSDALEDGRVVSGVGGQYNFVSMAHELDDGRSVLMLRATRESGGKVNGNIVWDYGHTTIARHLRDVYITEYGIADVRGKVDEDVVMAMCGIADTRDQAALVKAAKRGLKLDEGFSAPEAWSRNTAARVREALAPFRADGTLPDYPLGSDFTEVEQRLVKALSRLKSATATLPGKLGAIVSAVFTGAGVRDDEAMKRMGLDAPRGVQQHLYARLLAKALQAETREES